MASLSETQACSVDGVCVSCEDAAEIEYSVMEEE